jgi:4-methylaminobutanoate oxidase (formaldehyde-forming)
LGFAVKLDKPVEFIGREALRRAPRSELAKRLPIFTFPATELFAWGGEPILRDGAPVGELTSVGYSAELGQMVGMGFVHGAQPERAEQVLGSRYEIEVSGVKVAARASVKAPWPK